MGMFFKPEYNDNLILPGMKMQRARHTIGYADRLDDYKDSEEIKHERK